MVAKACVIVDIPNRYLPALKDQITIPCHRHADAYEILNALGYRDGKEYIVVAEGFLDENDNFLTRAEAWQEARRCYQFLDSYIEKYCDNVNPPTILYSEDVW